MDAIAGATRRSFRMPGRSYVVAFTLCPVSIAGWLEETDLTRARSSAFFAGKPVTFDLSAVHALRNRPAQASAEGTITKIIPLS